MANPFVINREPKSNEKMSLESALKVFQDMMSMGSNPQQIEQILLTKYPNLKSISDEVKKNGRSLLDFATQKYMQKNINVTPTIQRMLDMTKNSNSRY